MLAGMRSGMQKILAGLVWIAIAAIAAIAGIAAGTVWIVRHPHSPLLDPAADWPVAGLILEDLRHRPGPAPFTIPGEDAGEVGDGGTEDVPSLRPSRPRPAVPGAPGAVVFPPNIQPEGVERVVVKPGIPLLAEPRPGAARILVPTRVAVLKVLDRRPDWVKVQYGEVDGWVPDPAWIGPDPPLGSDPDPVRPVVGRPPDEELLARARARLVPPEAAGRLGSYLLYTDVQSAALLAFLDRVAAALDDTYRARYGVSPIGEPVEAVVLFREDRSYREFLDEDKVLAGLPAQAHTGYGVVALFDGGRTDEEVGAALVHELGHLLNRRAIGPSLPSWLDEGIADDLSQSRLDPSGRLVPGTLGGVTIREGRRIEMRGARAALQSLIAAAGTGTLRPLPELLALDWDDFVRRRADVNYAQASFFVRYLLQGEQGTLAPGFRSFLADVAGGMPPAPERLRERVGRPWPVLEAGYRLWLLSMREDRPLVP